MINAVSRAHPLSGAQKLDVAKLRQKMALMAAVAAEVKKG
jgi:hypothetical protein